MNQKLVLIQLNDMVGNGTLSREQNLLQKMVTSGIIKRNWPINNTPVMWSH